MPLLQETNTQVLGINVDSSPCQKAWAEKEGFHFPLLSDFPRYEVSKRYGVYLEDAGIANRGTFVIDKEGVVRYRLVTQPKVPRDHTAVLEILKKL